jgi:putative glycosyltransferase (TIGR04372 family)
MAIQAAYAGRPPLLQLTDEHRTRGIACLRQLGVPDGAWFVCVHCREPGYAPGEKQEYRDGDVDNYRLAMATIVERGGWCVRMGDPTMTHLPKMDCVVDYAHSDLRSDWMDVFLAASCRFFLGSASGLTNVASVFGVPSAIANQAPLSVVFPGGGFDIGIPKLFWSREKGRPLTFAEVLSCSLGDARFQPCYDDAGITIIDNSPEDIRDVTFEMLEFVDGTLLYSPEDEHRQAQLKSLFKPGHYSFGARSRAGRAFLRKYESLLVPPS